MSYKLLTPAWEIRGMSATSKLVLVRLCDFADESGVCWPGLTRIADDTGLCERAVRYAIIAIEKAGLLTRESHGSRGAIYTMKLANGAAFHPENPATDASINEGDEGNNRHVMPLKPASGANKPANGAEMAASGAIQPAPHATKQSRTSNEPAIEPPKNRSRARSRREDDVVEIPDWIPPSLWADFLDMRVRKRNAAAPAAQRMIVKKLTEFRAAGLDPIVSLGTAIERGYSSVWPPKPSDVPLLPLAQQPRPKIVAVSV